MTLGQLYGHDAFFVIFLRVGDKIHRPLLFVMCSVGRFVIAASVFSSGIVRLCRFILGIILLISRRGCSCIGGGWESHVYGWEGWDGWGGWGD